MKLDLLCKQTIIKIQKLDTSRLM